MQTQTPDTRVAQAINRVLEAEHATATVIAEAQAAAQSAIEAARESRRNILETARERVVRLHETVQSGLEARLLALDAAAAARASDDATLLAVTDAAIARVATRLTTDDSA